jgi:hypothetical protein
MDTRVQITSLEGWPGWQPAAWANPEGKRGDVPYIKIPINNITNAPLGQFGVADDSNTYMLIRVSLPDYRVLAGTNGITSDVMGGNGFSGFSWSTIDSSNNDLVVSTAPVTVYRYFLMPTNI